MDQVLPVLSEIKASTANHSSPHLGDPQRTMFTGASQRDRILPQSFLSQIFLVVVDVYSKWLEVAPMTFTTSETIVRVLGGLFATNGLPDILVTDNRGQFTSTTFERFLLNRGTLHALTVPFQPSSNSQAD